jgi:hypothetical protein
VEDRDDRYGLGVDLIDESKPTDDQLSKPIIPKFRDDSAAQWKFLEAVRRLDKRHQ